MRIYAMYFVVFVLLAFMINEFIAKEHTNNFLKYWLFINISLVISAFLFQRKLRLIVANDPNKMMVLAYLVNEDKLFDNVQLILHSKTHIPDDVGTYDNNADKVLQFSHQNPYVYDISHTVYDRNFIRFSWLAIQKTEPINLISKLKAGDVILYHRENSIIGNLIRFFTRCYWEHSATYIGEGVLIEASPGGVKKVNIGPWILDPKVSLGVLRPDIDIPSDAFVEMEKHIGDGYAYHKVLIHWWRIITGGTRLGFMTPIILLINMFQFGIALLIVFLFPTLTRLQIATILLTGPFMFDSIYHKVAYIKDLSFFNEVNHEKS